jgi:hypothetical protein
MMKKYDEIPTTYGNGVNEPETTLWACVVHDDQFNPIVRVFSDILDANRMKTWYEAHGGKATVSPTSVDASIPWSKS